MGDERSRRRQVAIFIVALILLDAPVLAVVDRLRLPPSGVPLTPFFLFLGWLAVIVMGALNTRRPRG